MGVREAKYQQLIKLRPLMALAKRKRDSTCDYDYIHVYNKIIYGLNSISGNADSTPYIYYIPPTKEKCKFCSGLNSLYNIYAPTHIPSQNTA